MGRRAFRAPYALVAFLLMLTAVAVSSPESALAAGPTAFETRVASGADDAEESDVGAVSLGSSDLELTEDGVRGEQLIGIRFTDVNVPVGAKITNAYVQFQTDETSTIITSLTIEGEASDAAQSFSWIDFDISSRPRTTSSIAWSPSAWNSVGEAGPSQRTPDLAAVVQEIVDRPGWAIGNSAVLILSGTGKRVAESFNGDPTAAALLHVEYDLGVSIAAVDDTASENPVSDEGLLRV